jgi:hypothetical protein
VSSPKNSGRLLKRRYLKKSYKTRTSKSSWWPHPLDKNAQNEDDGEELGKLEMGELGSIISQHSMPENNVKG